MNHGTSNPPSGPPAVVRRPIVGVMGSGVDSHEDLAVPLGRAIASAGWHLLTGGGGGTMTAVSRAFAETPGRAGLCLGVLPGAEDGNGSRDGYPNPWVEVAIRTHLPLSGAEGTGPDSRNHVNVLSADAVVALPGGPGTRSEIELAQRYERPLAVHDRPPGDSEQAAAAAADGALVFTDADDLFAWLKRTLRTVELTGQILKRDGLPDIVFVDLGSRMSNDLRTSWSEANPFGPGSCIHSLWLQPILGGIATVAASLKAGNIFVATANPATLIKIGTGVGSAVMGPSGIVSHAPFVAVGTSLLPVLAPVMVFATLSSMLIGTSLHRVEKILRELLGRMQRIEGLLEADDWGELKAADEALHDIQLHLENESPITDDVKFKHVLARDTLRKLNYQYEQLVNREVHSGADSHDRMFDIVVFSWSNLLIAKADWLNLHLTCQDDPDSRDRQQDKLLKMLAKLRERFKTLPQPLEKRMGALKKNLDKSRWFNTRSSVRKRIEKERDDIDEFFKSSLFAECVYAFEPSDDSIVIFHDDEGTLKAHKTRDVKLLSVACRVLPDDPDADGAVG